MIPVVTHADPSAILPRLRTLLPRLTPDRSSYARGRMRCWLGVEPMLFAPFETRPAVSLSDATRAQLEEAIGWRFDYCLVTWSGPDATGILPHRDAGYAASEAVGWNLTGSCVFNYWSDRSGKGDPSHVFNLEPGDVVRLDCKCQHAATPGVDRWAMNFWRRK